MITICLPTAGALEHASPLPEDVRPLIWNGKDPAPEHIEETEFLVIAGPAQHGQMIAAMPNLKVIQTTSAGVDYILGLVPEGVTLCDGRGVHGSSTSEWVLTVILAHLREIPGFLRARERHEWTQHPTDELVGKRVLVIGAGDLGEQTARRLRAFDAQPTMVARRKREGVHGTEEIPELLPHADIVVLVMPMTDETRHLVDSSFLAKMRDGALLVNAARGPVVVTDDLLAELSSGRLRAALDVTDPEPLPGDHPLWDAPNLLLTPHVGGYTNGLPVRAARLVREQLARYVAGEPLINVVEGSY